MVHLQIDKEETLAEEIRKYHVIYDNADNGYKDTVMMGNAWKVVVRNLDSVEDVKQAKLFLSNLKNGIKRKGAAVRAVFSLVLFP